MKMRICPNRSYFLLQSRPWKVLPVFMDSDTGILSPQWERIESESQYKAHLNVTFNLFIIRGSFYIGSCYFCIV